MKYTSTKVLKNIQLAPDIFVVQVERNDVDIVAGQFFMLKSWDKELTLMRPISVFKSDKDTISFMYRLVGQGTRRLSEVAEGTSINMLGPCGNGYPISQLKGRVAVVGGGVGIPPLCETARILNSQGTKVDAYLGFRDVVFAAEDFKEFCNCVYVSTEDGSTGHKGFVTDMLRPEDYDFIITCGPEVMMRKVVEISKKTGTQCYCSLEHRMACGIGACLGCSIRTAEGMKRVCKDGPVFNSSVLLW